MRKLRSLRVIRCCASPGRQTGKVGALKKRCPQGHCGFDPRPGYCAYAASGSGGGGGDSLSRDVGVGAADGELFDHHLDEHPIALDLQASPVVRW
jgi:hypothetical protein